MMRGYYGPMMGGYDFGIGWLLMGLFWLLVVVGIVVLIVWLARGGSHSPGHQMTGMHQAPGAPMPPPMHGTDEAMQIARKRLASGEITAEQFEELRKTLGG